MLFLGEGVLDINGSHAFHILAVVGTDLLHGLSQGTHSDY
jgi:hypothetical protein